MVGKGVFAGSVPETTAILRDLADCDGPCLGSTLQTYIADRLTGRHGPAWPGSLRLEQMIRITGQLGAALEFGPYIAFDDLSAQDQEAASACSWSYIANGEAGIRQALQVLQVRIDPRHSSCQIKKWWAFEPLLDEPPYPLPSNPLRRILDKHFASIVGT